MLKGKEKFRYTSKVQTILVVEEKTAIITHGEEENNDIDLNSKNRNKCLYWSLDLQMQNKMHLTFLHLDTDYRVSKKVFDNVRRYNPRRSNFASVISEGLMSEGLMSESLMSEGLLSEGLMSKGLMSNVWRCNIKRSNVPNV